MSPPDLAAVFFDIEALGVETAGWDGARVVGFSPDPALGPIIGALEPEVRLGVMAIDVGLGVAEVQRALSATAFQAAFDSSLFIAGVQPADPPFARALRAAGLENAPDLALYVGPDARLRTDAHAAGMRVAPHSLLAVAVLRGESLHYVRASGPQPGQSWSSLAQGRAIVPLLLAQEPHSVLYAIAARSAVDDLALHVAELETLGSPDDVATTSLTLFQLTADEIQGSQALRDFIDRLPQDAAFVRETPSGLVVGVPGALPVDALHPPDASHGHSRALLPSPGLLETAMLAGGFALRSLESWELAALAALDAGIYGQHLDPICGVTPLATPSGSVQIESRHIAHPGNADATDGLAMAFAQICGAEQSHRVKFGSVGGQPIYNVHAEIPGASPELVVVGAHLDSTAMATTNYPGNEDSEPAPGADDDASGVAAVLATAQVLKVLSEISPPHRTIRFVLFNAEEQGMVGSRYYAGWLKQHGAPVAAMLQMDMIGWVPGPYPGAPVEVHATGTGDYLGVSESSGQLASLVAGAATQVSPALSPQTYPVELFAYDPASNRSDHDSFQAHGWPAVLVCEDLWAEVAEVPTPWTGNPHYHAESDTTVQRGYAADVARAVAAAAWMIAKPVATLNDVIPVPNPIPADPVESGATTGGGPVITTNPVLNPIPQGSISMPNVFLVEFLAKWIRDEEFRCAVLHKETTALTDFGLDADQRGALFSLNEDVITERIKAEFRALGVDLAQLKAEVGGALIEVDPMILNPGGSNRTGGGPTLPGVVGNDAIRRAAFAALARQPAGGNRASVNPGGTGLPPIMLSTATTYTQGQIHIRGIGPTPSVPVGVEKTVMLRGQGFDAQPEVRFELGDEQVTGTVGEISCDLDVYQHVLVKVQLDKPGAWSVRARNTGTTEPWSTEDVELTAIAGT